MVQPNLRRFIYVESINYLCGCPRIEDGSEELQYNCGDVTIHRPEEENRSRRGKDESNYFEAFQVGVRI